MIRPTEWILANGVVVSLTAPRPLSSSYTFAQICRSMLDARILARQNQWEGIHNQGEEIFVFLNFNF